MRRWLIWSILMLGMDGAICQAQPEAPQRKEEAAMIIEVTSAAFAEGGTIPAKHTCEGEDFSPPLAWKGIPVESKSLALICDDPDAPVGTWVHWVLYNLPPKTAGLPEGVTTAQRLPDGSRQGVNDFGKTGYGGPCPPPGKPHRYFFKLYALDRMIELPAGAKKQDLERAMQGRVLAQGRLVGKYQR